MSFCHGEWLSCPLLQWWEEKSGASKWRQGAAELQRGSGVCAARSAGACVKCNVEGGVGRVTAKGAVVMPRVAGRERRGGGVQPAPQVWGTLKGDRQKVEVV